jgi:hypothetical protein
MISIDATAFDDYLKDNAKRNRQNDIANLSKTGTSFDPLTDQELFHDANAILSFANTSSTNNTKARLAEDSSLDCQTEPSPSSKLTAKKKKGRPAQAKQTHSDTSKTAKVKAKAKRGRPPKY